MTTHKSSFILYVSKAKHSQKDQDDNMCDFLFVCLFVSRIKIKGYLERFLFISVLQRDSKHNTLKVSFKKMFWSLYDINFHFHSAALSEFHT